jgi:hypothetical protein
VRSLKTAKPRLESNCIGLFALNTVLGFGIPLVKEIVVLDLRKPSTEILEFEGICFISRGST